MALISFYAVVIALAFWHAWVRRRFALTPRSRIQLRTTTADGWRLSVWFHASARRLFREPVVLCHGLGNNAAVFEIGEVTSLVQAVCDAGFDCYAVDLRGAGESTPPGVGPEDVTIDHHIRFDVPALVDLVKSHSGHGTFFWLGHSLGGVVGLAASMQFADGALAGLITIGSPLYYKLSNESLVGINRARHLALWGQLGVAPIEAIAPLVGRIAVDVETETANLKNISLATQRLVLAQSFAPIWLGVLNQLEEWALSNQLTSNDRQINYRDAIARLKSPVLIVAGSDDRLAPPEVAIQLHEALASSDKTLVLLGRAFGHQEDYGHGDLIVGKNAHEEVYPLIVRFLSQRATSAEGGGPID